MNQRHHTDSEPVTWSEVYKAMEAQAATLRRDFKEAHEANTERLEKIENDVAEIKPLAGQFSSFVTSWNKFSKAAQWSRRRIEAALLILVGDWAQWWWTNHGHSLFNKLIENLTH
jgi:hypothetical protein